ncbi:MAG: serine/threonine protein phosphatase [Alphaproteobacteria bacterium]|nr:MAG: serine/threonine protein phosphatase [Alphaproteobacteria bacterium]
MFKSWLARKRRSKSPPRPITPDSAFYAIGDIHGRLDLLQRLLGQFEAETPVFCVGDYVDRGEHSAEVLRFLHANPAITCLKGNHEMMLLGFLDSPKSKGGNWLRFGGLQTLASFGITGLSETAASGDLEKASAALKAAMGAPLIDWLRHLPLSWQSGNVALVHAGADPMIEIAGQREDFLVWGHPEFAKTPRPDGLWVVHGHTIVDAPLAKDGRISIDTGAYATGRLTAARIDADGVQFLST